MVCVVSVVGCARVWLLDFFAPVFSCICCESLCFFISFLILDLYFLVDDASMRWGYLVQTKHLFVLIHFRIKGEVGTVKHFWALQFFTDYSKVVLLFVDHFCYLSFMSAMLSCLLLAALWSPAGKGLTS